MPPSGTSPGPGASSSDSIVDELTFSFRIEYSAVVIVTQCRGERARDLLPEHQSLYVDKAWPIINLWGLDGANKLIYSLMFARYKVLIASLTRSSKRPRKPHSLVGLWAFRHGLRSVL